jgi:hypothetical protein
MSLAAILGVRQLDARRSFPADHEQIRGTLILVDVRRTYTVGDPFTIGRYCDVTNLLDAMHVFGLEQPTLDVLCQHSAAEQAAKQNYR